MCQLLELPRAADGWNPDLQSKDVRAVIAASVAINILVLAVPFYINRVYTSVLPQQSGDSLLVITAMLFAVVLLDLLLKILRAWVLTLLNGSQEHLDRLAAIRHYLSAPLGRAQSQSLDQRLEQVRAASLLRNRFLQQWIFQRIDLPFVILYLLVMLLIGGWLAFIPVLTACALYPQARRASREAMEIIHARYSQQEARDDVLLSALSGTETIKGLGIEGFLVRRLEPVQESLSSTEYQQQVINARLQHVGQLYAQATGLLVVTMGSILVIHDSLAVGALAACTLLSRQVSRPFSRYFALAPRLALIDYGVNKLNQLKCLEAESSFHDGLTSWPQGIVQLGSLRIGSGESIVITADQAPDLTNFVSGLLGHQGTSVQPLRVGDLDVTLLRSSERRKCLRSISSRPRLFNGTVLENLTAFRPVSRRDQAIQLCQSIGIHGALIALPRGYETLIGEQADFPIASDLAFRISVASALMDQPGLLIIDGSDHALDELSFGWLDALPVSVPRLIVVKLLPYSLRGSLNVLDIHEINGGVAA